MPDLARLEHFGAAAASSGGVEMRHPLGVALEAPNPTVGDDRMDASRCSAARIARSSRSRKRASCSRAAAFTPTRTGGSSRGRGGVGGVAEGQALVTRQHIFGWGGLDPRTGAAIESRHAPRGVSFAGEVLASPGAEGSSGWSNQFHMARLSGAAPAAVLSNETTTATRSSAR